MPRLVKDVELLKILVKYYGFEILRQKGSHIFLTDGKHFTTIPYHNRALGKGLFKQILTDCGLSREDVYMYL